MSESKSLDDYRRWLIWRYRTARDQYDRLYPVRSAAPTEFARAADTLFRATADIGLFNAHNKKDRIERVELAPEAKPAN
jgi:hypothetical protein